MTTVSLNDEASNMGELSSNELDQVTGGRSGAHGGDVIPALMIAAAAVPIVGAIVAGVLRAIFGSE